MHIAICDDNIADRKQLERLLKRESDKRMNTTGLLYTDSFGGSNMLTKNHMQYDLFFIDIVTEQPDGLTFALELIKSGVTAPIVLCSSKINYLEQMNVLSPCPSNLMHLEKPIKTAALSDTLDKAHAIQSKRVPTIELRSETDTYYVTEDDIVYALTFGRYVHVFLKDGREVAILTDMYNFYDEVSMYTHMVLLNDHAMFNIVYMDKYSPFKVVLQDGTELKSSPFSVKYIKSALQMYHTETL